ncbi:MAG TPA: radical SAM protein [Candidatus Sulfomarinibacteraceae bacterium]|nr:radical SAM protein [Candidatus Sulfomarinibacteraceae bacterium]
MPSIKEMAQRQLTLRTHRIHTLPVVVLMPHSRCNCRCVMCDIWKANRNGEEIGVEQLRPHLDAFRRWNVQWVTLSGGEALMHSNLWALCRELKALPARITLLSTGLLLEKHAADVVRWCDEVIISLDGSREVHDAIRNVPRAYERLAEGVAAVQQAHQDLVRSIDFSQSGSFPIHARCVLQRRNFHDLPRIIDAARELGLDQISFLAADVSSSAFNRPQGWNEERVTDVALSREEARRFEEVLEETFITHAADFESGFVAESPRKLRRLGQYFAALNGDAPFPPVTCNAPWVSTVVEADGTVRPCFFHRALGNIHEQPLEEILNAEEAIAFRRDLDMARDPICRKCVCTLHIGPRAEVNGG